VNIVDPLRDRVRTLLRIRVPRDFPPAGIRPCLGARLVCDDLRMSVQAGMSEGLWRWLVSNGWREVMFRPDRRRYREIPSAFVTQLIDAAPDERPRLLRAAIANASFRPRPARPAVWENTRS
jgi:hypothetical protein